MELDIQYLLFLQGIREATGGSFDEFFNCISKLAVDIMYFLPFIVFWACDKKWGYRFLYALFGGNTVNSTVKLSVCAYRPWIRSDLIQPAGDSKVAATGYSFPSGHTLHATADYGTAFLWLKDKRRWLAYLSAFMIVLTGFSRNFLGVHTPQDVVVGFLIGVISITIASKVASLSASESFYDKLTLLGIALAILSLVYVIFKPYPMDYVDGALLVDPKKMMVDHFKEIGSLLGLLIGSYLERHSTHYEIPVGSKNLPILTCLGLGIMFSWKKLFADATIVLLLGSHWGNLVARFLMVFFAIYLWPKVIAKNA